MAEDKAPASPAAPAPEAAKASPAKETARKPLVSLEDWVAQHAKEGERELVASFKFVEKRAKRLFDLPDEYLKRYEAHRKAK